MIKNYENSSTMRKIERKFAISKDFVPSEFFILDNNIFNGYRKINHELLKHLIKDYSI